MQAGRTEETVSCWRCYSSNRASQGSGTSSKLCWLSGGPTCQWNHSEDASEIAAECTGGA
jgi:hypothetical protein